MKNHIYPRLAWTGIKKNKIMYLPYLLTCILMVAMFYILSYLSKAGMVSVISGGDSLQFTLKLGSFVIGAFSVVFLFYTNSFLLRRRKREFGLYNVLGMGKPNLAKILFWETLMVAGISLGAGLSVGILLSKLAELVLMNIIAQQATYSFTLCPEAIWLCIAIFSGVFLIIFLNALRQVGFSNPTELLHSENVGEKPPKANWVLGIGSLLLLGGAYYLAVSIDNPVDALIWFFVAVLMVIAGSYLLLISGSVLLCKILKSRKSYYYKPNHFVSVSSMAYRMKRNGAGLASICILATMVLVMISSSACLYFGTEDSLSARYPRDVMLSVQYASFTDCADADAEEIFDSMGAYLAENHVDAKHIMSYRAYQISGILENGILDPDVAGYTELTPDYYQRCVTLEFIPLSDYVRSTGRQVTLGEGEAIAYGYRMKEIPDSLTLDKLTYQITETLESFPITDDSVAGILPVMYLIVNDASRLPKTLNELKDYTGSEMLTNTLIYCFDVEENQTQAFSLAKQQFGDLTKHYGMPAVVGSLMEQERMDFYNSFGGLFFIGIMLSIVFLVATVLIIYYKQLCEGYEDQSRFEIMQTVGMTRQEIRKSINSQMLTVFFLPLGMACLHLAFAFPLIRKILMLFNIFGKGLLVLTTAVSIIIFALFYLIVYRITSNAYFKIVSGIKRED